MSAKDIKSCVLRVNPEKGMSAKPSKGIKRQPRQENPMLLCNYGTYLRVAFFYQSIAPARRRHAHRTVVPAARHLLPRPLASLSQRLTRPPPRASSDRLAFFLCLFPSTLLNSSAA
jgi:hypothetical protein